MKKPTTSGAQPSRALSSVYGKIEQILVSQSGERRAISTEHLHRYYAGLFREFSDRVSFVVMGHFGQDAEQGIREQLAAEGLDPDLVYVHTPLCDDEAGDLVHKQGEFIQDPFVIMESQHGETFLLEPYRSHLEQNAFLAEQFADATGYALLPTRYLLEGGNILIGDDYAFVGRNLLERNRQRFFAKIDPLEAERQITRDLKKALGMRYLFWIGGTETLNIPLRQNIGPEGMQPFYHIDLFMTLGGKSKKGDEIVLLAEIDLPSFDPPLSPTQMEALTALNDALAAVKVQLLNISCKMPGPRLQIVEIPMTGIIHGEGADMVFTPYSYNNAQVEWYHGISRIYLPHFPGKDALEQRLLENLPSLGFGRITFIRHAFEKYAERHGGLHCLTKVLRRSDY